MKLSQGRYRGILQAEIGKVVDKSMSPIAEVLDLGIETLQGLLIQTEAMDDKCSIYISLK